MKISPSRFITALFFARSRAATSGTQFVVGSGSGQYATIAAAVKALEAHDNDGGEVTLLISSGTYNEQVRVRLYKASLVVAGDGSGEVDIKFGASARIDSGAEQGATVVLRVPKATVRNVNIYNTATPIIQAPAYYQPPGTYSHTFENVGLYSMQDTLHAEGDLRIRKSKIVGQMDFICGGKGRIVISDSELLLNGPGAIAASAKDSADSKSVIFISDSTIAAAPGSSVRARSTHLGRAWRAFAHVVVQRTSISDVISPSGWTTMGGTTSLGNTNFQECDNTGAGASTSRRTASKSCTPVDPDSVLP